MRKLLTGLFFLGLFAGVLWIFRSPLLEKTFEITLNPLHREFFEGTLDFEGVQLNPDLKLGINRLTGELKGPEKNFPFEIRDIRFVDSLTCFVTGCPISITFAGFRPQESQHEGARGRATLLMDSNETFVLEADVLALHLEELEALDPDSLENATGRLTGALRMKSGLKGTELFELSLKVQEPGGRIQARFFEVFLPYLPAVEQEVLSRLSKARTGTVEYKKADIRVSHPAPEALHIQLHILVPEYHLNLNLNVTVRVETEEVFVELARLAGLIKAEPL